MSRTTPPRGGAGTVARALLGCGLLVVGLFTAGCGSGAPVRGFSGRAPTTAQLVTAAALAPCPATAAVPARAGGLPAASLRCLVGGREVRLSGLRGRPMLLAIWATWCENCLPELPVLQRASQRAGGRLRVLGLDFEDTDREALSFDAHAGIHFPSVVDPLGSVTRSDLQAATGPPVTLFVDPSGVVVHRQFGTVGTLAQLTSALARYLGVRL